MKRHHTATAGRIVFTIPSLQACWNASRKKRSAFTTFLREVHRSGATSGGKPLGNPVGHRTRSRKKGLPAPERSRPAACGEG